MSAPHGRIASRDYGPAQELKLYDPSSPPPMAAGDTSRVYNPGQIKIHGNKDGSCNNPNGYSPVVKNGQCAHRGQSGDHALGAFSSLSWANSGVCYGKRPC